MTHPDGAGADDPGPSFGFVGPFSEQERAELEAAEAEARATERDMYRALYALARQMADLGHAPDAIRAELMAGAGDADDLADLGEYLRERMVSVVRSAIEDALSGRPPRHPGPFETDAEGLAEDDLPGLS